MANLPEVSSFDAVVYEIATTDPVIGGDQTSISNKQAYALGNRTRWLKDQVDSILSTLATIASLDSPIFTGNPRAPTASADDDDTTLATTAFVHRNSGGYKIVDVSGNANHVLTGDEWGVSVIILVGALTGSINVIFPTRGDRWLVLNRTTGLYQITCKTAAGAGVKVAQTRSKSVFCDGTDILSEETDLSTRGRVITAATTLAPGDVVYVDFTGGVFAVTLPANPSNGDEVTIIGEFAASNLTVNRNGQSIRDKDGVAQAANALLDRNATRATFGFYAGAWEF